jgi:hypothetical protein
VDNSVSWTTQRRAVGKCPVIHRAANSHGFYPQPVGNGDRLIESLGFSGPSMVKLLAIQGRSPTARDSHANYFNNLILDS